MLLETTCMSVKIYHPVEWTVLLVSLLSAAAFVIAMRLLPGGKAPATRRLAP
jgi:hypothetical protein